MNISSVRSSPILCIPPQGRVTFEPLSKITAVAKRSFDQIRDQAVKDKVKQMFFEAVKSMYQQIHEICMSILKNIHSRSQ